MAIMKHLNLLAIFLAFVASYLLLPGNGTDTKGITMYVIGGILMIVVFVLIIIIDRKK
jgi:hypothetical protein